ncbi:MAG TPA: RNA-binding S4 domain-containing protein [Thermohalobaculum sp.]|nr:RNA-binding S4 domain-containing protein [Thermohalobaculum sp.]
MAEPAAKLRVDKWLWQARFFKSRGLAGEVAASGRLRVNGTHVDKPAHGVRPGDVLTFPQGRSIRVIRVEALGFRRGPAAEAATLYSDLDPPAPPAGRDAPQPATAQREPGQGRPTKRERRKIDAIRRPPP